MRVKGKSIFIKISIELFCSKHFSNPNQLVVVVMPMEKRLFAENLQKVVMLVVESAVVVQSTPR